MARRRILAIMRAGYGPVVGAWLPGLMGVPLCASGVGRWRPVRAIAGLIGAKWASCNLSGMMGSNGGMLHCWTLCSDAGHSIARAWNLQVFFQ